MKPILSGVSKGVMTFLFAAILSLSFGCVGDLSGPGHRGGSDRHSCRPK